jgi:AAA+ ATPase superfamily predicted ATPase
MRARDYFPLGIASGYAFCNRTDQTRLLTENIKNGKHTLLIATRRYGKSSLALRAIEASGLPYVETDFYMASNEKVVEAYILQGVVDLIGKSLGSIEKMATSIKKYVKNLKPKLNLGTDHIQLELTADIASDPATNVKEGLQLLEKLLAEKNRQAVFLMDEFQNVGLIAQGRGIEAAIRHVAQKTKYLTIIFSGSNRNLLKTMFEDENRPLYKLCWKLTLKRISKDHYVKHLQKAAKEFWHDTLNDDALNAITSLSERHPFYLNKLCDRLWTYYEKKPPTKAEVDKTWMEILEEEKSDAVKEISSLSLGQKSVVLEIAKNPEKALTSKQSVIDLQMSSSSIMTALNGLEEKDVVEWEDEQYHIINPVVKHYVLA